MELDVIVLDVAVIVGRERLRLILWDEMRLDLLELLTSTVDDELLKTD